MHKIVLSPTRNFSQSNSFNFLPHPPVAEHNKYSPNPLFAKKILLSDSRLNANTAPYFPQQSRTTNMHVQAEPVQVVEAAINEFTLYGNVKIGGLTTKVLFDSGCSRVLYALILLNSC